MTFVALILAIVAIAMALNERDKRKLMKQELADLWATVDPTGEVAAQRAGGSGDAQ
jgi:hypothetical protein